MLQQIYCWLRLYLRYLMRLVPGTIFTLLFTASMLLANAQNTCPDNIGFENGSFMNWKCYSGQITSGGSINLGLSNPIDGRHSIIQNVVPPQMDRFGGFPISCPNGSGYSVKLGNELTGAQADRVSYTFTVPANKNEYSIIYNYAIVFQNPGHSATEQPRFTSKVFDETEGQYLGCGAFEFVASSGLPGFQVSSVGTGVWYKPWSPVTVKLMNCAGKTITLEFTVNDCSPGGHFGYAYLDVNENCSSPITGNVYCNGATSLTLSAPYGFKEYNWYTADFSTLLGTSNILKLSPIPPVGTKYALEIVPYPGLGCLDTLYTIIEKSNQAFNFKLIDTVVGCSGYPADLTSSLITQGSSPGLRFSYFQDSIQLNYVPTPTYVTNEGLYYIKAENFVGCTEVKKTILKFRDIKLAIKDPPETCFPNTVNLTASAITAGSDPGLTYSYWFDDLAQTPVANPAAINKTGYYYIKAQAANCKIISRVNVQILTADQLITTPMANCGSVNLTDPVSTGGSSPSLQFSYWMNNAATVPVTDPKNVTTTGVYYVKGTTASGCSFVKPININIKPAPDFSILPPAIVTAPVTIDIINAISSVRNYTFTYWLDSNTTKPLNNPNTVQKTGTYYVKAADTTGCYTIKPISVTVLIPAKPDIRYPNAFSPNGDGVNDAFRIDIAGDITLNTFKIYNRWGQVVFETKDPLKYWYGDNKGKALPAGTYYWIMELENNYDKEFYKRSGAITLLR